VHHSGVVGEHAKGMQNLVAGQKVEYEIGQHEKGPMCVNVRVIGDAGDTDTDDE